MADLLVAVTYLILLNYFDSEECLSLKMAYQVDRSKRTFSKVAHGLKVINTDFFLRQLCVWEAHCCSLTPFFVATHYIVPIILVRFFKFTLWPTKQFRFIYCFALLIETCTIGWLFNYFYCGNFFLVVLVSTSFSYCDLDLNIANLVVFLFSTRR